MADEWGFTDFQSSSDGTFEADFNTDFDSPQTNNTVATNTNNTNTTQTGGSDSTVGNGEIILQENNTNTTSVDAIKFEEPTISINLKEEAQICSDKSNSTNLFEFAEQTSTKPTATYPLDSSEFNFYGSSSSPSNFSNEGRLVALSNTN